MATISIQGDKRILQITSGIKLWMKNPKKTMVKIGDFLIEEFQDNFPAEGSRLGSKWKALAASTQAQRARLGYGAAHPILERTGALKRGFEKQVKRLSVRVFNPVDYFQYHQMGGGKLPQRKMIDAPEKIKTEVVRMIQKDLGRKVKGK